MAAAGDWGPRTVLRSLPVYHPVWFRDPVRRGDRAHRRPRRRHFDGASLVQTFENQNPANTIWTRQCNLWSTIEPERYPGFEKWRGGHITLDAEEMQWIVDALFVGIHPASGDPHAGGHWTLIREAKCELLMKGGLHTDELMRAVIATQTGLRTERRISHVFIMDVPGHPETPFITDAAVNILPDLDVKRDIVHNATDLWTGVGLGTPRLAILSAVETMTNKIPSTSDAAALCRMADRGRMTGGLLDGPRAFDTAEDPEAARVEGIASTVAGRAQILVVPDLEAGNMLAKNLSFLARAAAAGIGLGARVLIILTSRAAPVRTRLASCAVAAIYADARCRATAMAAA
jgi:phosphate acetyltransferase